MPEPKATASSIAPVSQRGYWVPYCLTSYIIYDIIKEKGDYMLYVVFNPKTKMAYCKRVHLMTVDKLVTIIRCREYEYKNYIREVGKEWRGIMVNGGLENIRICFSDDPEEDRMWPYVKFTSYRYDYDLELWLDSHPKLKIESIASKEEYEKEMQYYRERYWNK